MASPFERFEVEKALRASPRGLAFDLDQALDAIVILHARAPDDASTAGVLGTERLGNGVVIGQTGLVLTIGYLVTEAEEVTLITNSGRRVPAHALGADPVTGFGLVQALEPLDLPALPLGDSRRLRDQDALIVAGGGGRAHAMSAQLVARAPFAGYWEYMLDEALFTGPGHPHWSGAAVIGPSGALMGVGSLQMVQQLAGGRPALLNMSVPIELLPPILDDLSRGRPSQPPRPWLGLYAQDTDAGVVVMDVAPGGPADRAEFRQGDIILAVGDVAVSDLTEFYKALWGLGPAGVSASLRLKRDGDAFTVDVRTIDRASRLKKRRFN